MTDSWLAEAAAAVGVDAGVMDVNALLGLARDVAHGVERKQAPLSTFLVGYAAGARGADRAEIAELIQVIQDMCPPGEPDQP
jgi:Domain of unknown function (DUF6457)